MKTKSPAEIARNPPHVRIHVKRGNSQAEVSLSQITVKTDDTRMKNKLIEVNKRMQATCQQKNWGLIDNGNISNMHLNPYGLHLNKRGMLY